jgi:hypothetical protein
MRCLRAAHAQPAPGSAGGAPPPPPPAAAHAERFDIAAWLAAHPPRRPGPPKYFLQHGPGAPWAAARDFAIG